MTKYARMKAGMVVQIRVHPEDCLSILDLIQSVGGDPYDGRSFAQMVSFSLKSLIGVAIRGGIVGEPDREQFLNRMAPFIESRNNKRKHDASEAMYVRAAHGIGMPVPHITNLEGAGVSIPRQDAASPLLQLAARETDNRIEEYKKEYREIQEKLDRSEATPADLERFMELDRIIYPI